MIDHYIKFRAEEDRPNHRFVIRPLYPNGKMDVPTVLRTIRESTNYKWREIAEFCGIEKQRQSKLFKVAYVRDGNYYYVNLKKSLVIDVPNNCAYFYDKDHQPDSVAPEHVAPVLQNNEDTLTIKRSVPTKVTTRLLVKDPLDRILTMTLKPQNGYLIGVNDVTVAMPNTPYVISGAPKLLNQFLRNIYFVGLSEGDASVIVIVDDGDGATNSKDSTTVTLVVEDIEELSTPQLILPEELPTLTTGQYNAIPAITVSDEDDKLMTLRISSFGCYVSGFKSFIHALVPGKVKATYGRAENINADIANLQVYPYKTNAQIGIELVYDHTVIRKYLAFEIEGEDVPAPEVQQSTLLDNHIGLDSGTGFKSTESTGAYYPDQVSASTSNDVIGQESLNDESGDIESGSESGPVESGGESGEPQDPVQNHLSITANDTSVELAAETPSNIAFLLTPDEPISSTYTIRIVPENVVLHVNSTDKEEAVAFNGSLSDLQALLDAMTVELKADVEGGSIAVQHIVNDEVESSLLVNISLAS